MRSSASLLLKWVVMNGVLCAFGARFGRAFWVSVILFLKFLIEKKLHDILTLCQKPVQISLPREGVIQEPFWLRLVSVVGWQRDETAASSPSLLKRGFNNIKWDSFSHSCSELKPLKHSLDFPLRDRSSKCAISGKTLRLANITCTLKTCPTVSGSWLIWLQSRRSC